MLYLAESGPADAPPIVLLHGGGLSGRMWQPQVERLADFRCLVPDLPEQGRSAQVAPFTLDGAARAVAQIIRERTPAGKAHVVGLSLGGAVGLTLLRLAPETIDRLLVSGTAAGLGRGLGAVAMATAWLNRLLPADLLLDASYRQFGIPAAYRPLIAEDMRRSLDPDFTRHITAALMAMELPRSAAAPTLAVVGSRETIPARRAQRRIIAVVRGARGAVAQGLGHVWSLQAPDLFTATVRAWVTDAPLPPGVAMSNEQ